MLKTFGVGVGLLSGAFYKPRPRPEIHRRLRRQPREHRVGGCVLGHFGQVDLVQRVVFGLVVIEIARAVLAIGRGRKILEGLPRPNFARHSIVRVKFGGLSIRDAGNRPPAALPVTA